jgi:hypothetical protein
MPSAETDDAFAEVGSPTKRATKRSDKIVDKYFLGFLRIGIR